MAITASGAFVQTFLDALGTTGLALDLDVDTHKLALFDNTITPDFQADTAYGSAPYDAGEVTDVVEKPDDPPSNLVMTGFYTFTPAI